MSTIRRVVCALVLGGCVGTAVGDPGLDAARAALYASHGGAIHNMVDIERLEFSPTENEKSGHWDIEGWIGGDRHKFLWQTEAEYEFTENAFEKFEVHALYSRALAPFWDVQVGLRHDLKPNPSRSYFALGIRGIAPYWIELESALFVSNKGDLSVRLSSEYDLRMTQQWLLQPRIELNTAFADDPGLSLEEGITKLEFGVRARFEWRPSFAPYVGFAWERLWWTRADGDKRGSSHGSFVAGVRVWF